MAMVEVAVLGSINLDVVIGVERFPRPGETILSRSVAQTSGGKGANQAIAAARMGRSTAMIGAVGSDDPGRNLTAVLEDNGVEAFGVAALPDAATGMAHVIVDAKGQNQIIVHPGANGRVTPGLIADRAPRAKVVLAQLETPPAAIEAFFQQARERGATTVLNTAPALPDIGPLFDLADVVVLNESELLAYAGRRGEAATRARKIARPGQTVIVTLGAAGALAVTPEETFTVPARLVQALDTTGAGDVFCGVLAAGLAEGRLLPAAMARANAAAAISVTRTGAALSAPILAELEDFLVSNP
jgi:ribokinase